MSRVKRSLVVMTNGDVYYVEREAIKLFITNFDKPVEPAQFHLVTDLKSGAIVAINTAHISSIVSSDTNHV